jgi:hypothetical protein
MIRKAILAAKRSVVIALEDVCGLTGHHFCHRLAAKSAKLDEKWNTSVWTVIEGGNEK